MSRSKVRPFFPEAMFRAYGEPPRAEVKESDVGAVVPLRTCSFACYGGPLALRAGVPIVVDAQLRRELKECGVIA